MSWSITRLQLGRKKKQFFILSRQSSIYLEFFLAQVLSCGGDAGATFPFVDRLTRINKSTLGERKEIYTQRTAFSAPQKQKKAAGDILFYILFHGVSLSLAADFILRVCGDKRERERKSNTGSASVRDNSLELLGADDAKTTSPNKTPCSATARPNFNARNLYCTSRAAEQTFQRAAHKTSLIRLMARAEVETPNLYQREIILHDVCFVLQPDARQ